MRTDQFHFTKKNFSLVTLSTLKSEGNFSWIDGIFITHVFTKSLRKYVLFSFSQKSSDLCCFSKHCHNLQDASQHTIFPVVCLSFLCLVHFGMFLKVFLETALKLVHLLIHFKCERDNSFWMLYFDTNMNLWHISQYIGEIYGTYEWSLMILSDSWFGTEIIGDNSAIGCLYLDTFKKLILSWAGDTSIFGKWVQIRWVEIICERIVVNIFLCMVA